LAAGTYSKLGLESGRAVGKERLTSENSILSQRVQLELLFWFTRVYGYTRESLVLKESFYLHAFHLAGVRVNSEVYQLCSSFLSGFGLALEIKLN